MDCALTSIDMVLLLFQSVDVAAGGLIPVRLFSVAPDYSPTKHVAYHFGSILLMFKYGLQSASLGPCRFSTVYPIPRKAQMFLSLYCISKSS